MAILGWRVLRNRIPNRWNLSKLGLEIESILCPICTNGIETTEHTFIFCEFAVSVWDRVFKWLHLDRGIWLEVGDIFGWVDSICMRKEYLQALEAICFVTIWVIWRHRNEIVFDDRPPKRSYIFDQIKDVSFEWFSGRNRKVKVRWTNWIQDPLLAIFFVISLFIFFVLFL